MSFTLDEFSLAGKVALVTGASRGIGKEIALGLAACGADVALASRKPPDLEEAAREIEALGRRSLAVMAHAGRMDDIASLVSQVQAEFGQIDILVNGAGTTAAPDSALDQTERGWDAVMNLNLKGLFFLSQTVAKLMKEQGGGAIINMASAEGITPGHLAAYDISKAGVIHATKVMAKAWAKYGIRVNAIAPGLVRTRMTESLWSVPEKLQKVTTRTPMGRMAEPEEMVGAVVYLASKASSYVTGQTIVLDGGVSI